MPRKTIYVSSKDEATWERAEQLVEQGTIKSLSRLIINAIEKEVSKLELTKEIRNKEEWFSLLLRQKAI